MPQTITPAGIELNPQTEPIQDPNPLSEKTEDTEANPIYEPSKNTINFSKSSDENKN